MTPGRPAVSWWVRTLPLAPLAGAVYFLAEWVFFVTKPSPLAALPFPEQALVLVRSPIPALLWLVAIQAAASTVALLAYSRARYVALAPGALVGGALLLLLVDNFTYTVFGFGLLTVGMAVRVVYAALLPAMVVAAAWKMRQWTDAPVAAGVLWAALILVAVTIGGTVAVAGLHDAAPDRSAPPTLEGGSASGRRPNILLLGIDGVNATAMSVYGAQRKTTPFLETIGDESLMFENAFSNVGRTHGSLVALLTGRLPFSTHVTFPPTVLQGEDAHRHLPGLLKGLGYMTLQLGMRHYADAEDANLLGFDAANYRWQNLDDVRVGEGQDEASVFRAEVVERLDQRLAQLFGFQNAVDGFAHVEGKQESPYWSDARRVDTLTRFIPTAPEPWFVHAHLLDTHCCSYHPHTNYFAGDGVENSARDSQLRESDEQVRQVFEALRSSGRLERTLVVISSDHTNGWTTKGRVPLIMRFPGAQRRGVVSANVQLVDVAPTVLDFLGQPIPAWMDGVAIDEGDPLPERPIFGVSDILERTSVAPQLRALPNAGPPNYGSGTATVIHGGHWYELDLRTGAFEYGAVAGHPDAASAAAPERARQLLDEKLRSAGFKITSSALPREAR